MKQLTHKDRERIWKEFTQDIDNVKKISDLLKCPFCKRKFKKLDEFTYKPNCKKWCKFTNGKTRLSVG